MTLCECGCGQEVNLGNRFINGHAVRCTTKETRRKLSEWQIGRKLSEEHKKKLSESHKGIKFTEEHKQKISLANKGRKYTIEQRQKISKAIKGDKNPAWKGGISHEPYCHKFNNAIKEQIRNKYNRKCFLCSKTENDNNHRKLSIHHVDYNKN